MARLIPGLVLASFVALAGCAATPDSGAGAARDRGAADAGAFATPLLVPAPATIERRAGALALTADTTVCFLDPRAESTARFLARWLAVRAGERCGSGDIALELVQTFAPEPPEQYALEISAGGAVLRSSSESGLFYGAVTLRQLALETRVLPALAITDAPRLRWRGLMLDVARHFRSVEFVERTVDWMALYKLNTLHLHLTDDQGWRIAIDRYPELTEIGAVRRPASAGTTVPTPIDGYYAKDDIRRIVAYAAERHVTVVPEIEMPGHAQAAIAAYPELGTGGRPAVSNRWGVHTELFNVDEATFAFLERVLDEVIALFPSQYVHVGGDEAAKDRWESSPAVQARMRALGIENAVKLQGYFTARIGEYLAGKGKKLVGWDEILDGGVPTDATVMSWRGEAGAAKAAEAGHDVIMATHPTLYMDFLQADERDRPGRPAYVSLADVYAYDPVPASLAPAAAERVIGAQVNVWTEHLRTAARVEHAAWPRAAALAERLWSPRETTAYDDFARRLAPSYAMMRAAGADLGPLPGSLREAEAGKRAAPSAGSRSESGVAAGASIAFEPCKRDLLLRLEDDAPRAASNASRAVYDVDLFEPCWRIRSAALAGTGAIRVAVGQLPYNFELWHDAGKIVTQPKIGPHGALAAARCEGGTFATAALDAAQSTDGVTVLEVPLAGRGAGDVCLRFATGTHDPIWAVESVEIAPR